MTLQRRKRRCRQPSCESQKGGSVDTLPHTQGGKHQHKHGSGNRHRDGHPLALRIMGHQGKRQVDHKRHQGQEVDRYLGTDDGKQDKSCKHDREEETLQVAQPSTLPQRYGKHTDTEQGPREQGVTLPRTHRGETAKPVATLCHRCAPYGKRYGAQGR